MRRIPVRHQPLMLLAVVGLAAIGATFGTKPSRAPQNIDKPQAECTKEGNDKSPCTNLNGPNR